MAELLRQLGFECRVVTWLPRLSGNGVESIYSETAEKVDSERATSLAEHAGFPDPAMAADYDRDWYFASTSEKRRHALRIISAAGEIIKNWGPNALVSAVGGETLRVVFDALARSFGVLTLYFNAIPLAGRFVLLPSMSAAFVPREGEFGYKPSRWLPDDLGDLKSCDGPAFVNHLQESRFDGVARLFQTKLMDAGVYPRHWWERKSWNRAKAMALSSIAVRESARRPNDVNVLYPMHDERDFQVAVRERHAVPQVHLLRYVASTLPPGYRLWVKPHPHHLEAHHQLLLREIRYTPNIGFLDPATGFSEAIADCDVVFTLASTLGFEALRRGKPVVCYGTPFYSGCGVTEDVRDPRQISAAIVRAVGMPPHPREVERLIYRMEEYSWEGQFTPISLEVENLRRMSLGILDVLRAEQIWIVQ
ncbi:capsular polysaccharide export protein, LipB/KpsS family [Rhodococcus ruber]|uniref:capsular polysaccharide export protein, LipB/KpsS family n=1 Tax=Rhodococcus ruber TaxID=1830 RepID=UPI001F279408|nr:hypothetical protein [Rhodococcus ruber]MCF8781347.1 hypothetical protein [Rhodococcus ruber]